MKGVNLARKASKEPDHENEPEATRPQRRQSCVLKCHANQDPAKAGEDEGACLEDPGILEI